MENCARKLAAALVLAIAASGCASLPPPRLDVIETLDLGGPGGWDYLAVDGRRNRLFVTRREHVQVLDLGTRRIIGGIPGLQGVHGVALAQDLGVGFTSNGAGNSITAFDLETLAVLETIPVTGTNPDAILYEPTMRHVYAFNHNSANATVLDAVTRKVVNTIPLLAKLETGVTDGKGTVYVNSEGTNEIAVIDARAGRMTRKWALGTCIEATGLALDAVRGRLFAACKNRVMVVVRTRDGGIEAEIAIGEGADGAGFDAALGLAYASNRDGTLSVVGEDGAGRLQVLQTVTTEPGAKTMVVDSASHRLYLPNARFAPAAGSTARTMVPDSFHLIVVGPR